MTGQLRPRSQGSRLRVLLLPGEDLKGLVRMPAVAERIGQMPGDHPGERVVAGRLGAGQTVFQQTAGRRLICGLRDERQCRARGRGGGGTGDLSHLGQIAALAAGRQGVMPYRVAEQFRRAVPVAAAN